MNSKSMLIARRIRERMDNPLTPADILALRSELDLSAVNMGDLLDIAPSTISRLENGNIPITKSITIKLDYLRILCDFIYEEKRGRKKIPAKLKEVKL